MHELSIVEGIVETAIPLAEKSGAVRILKISLKIGELTGIVEECVREYFSIASKGTIAENAELSIEIIPAEVHCRSCGYDGVLKDPKYLCPRCGSDAIFIHGGNTYYIDSLEVE